MVIEILNEKYRCGCRKGMTNFKRKRLLEDLNSLIEWKFCRFPSLPCGKADVESVSKDGGMRTETITIFAEDRRYLGDNPKLSPGIVFKVDGNVIAVESDEELVLLITETGIKSLQRFISERIDAEREMRFIYDELTFFDSVRYEVIGEIPEEYQFVESNYKFYKIFNEKFCTGRIDKDKYIKATYITKKTLFPIELILDGWKVYYSPEDFDDSDKDYIVDISERIMSVLVNTNDRVAEVFPPIGTREEQIEFYQRQAKLTLELMKELKPDKEIKEEP